MSQAGPDPDHRVALGLLGPVTLTVDGQPLALGGARPRSVLALLGLEAGRVVPTSRLVEAIWGEEADPDKAVGSLQVHVSNLRRALRPAAGALDLPGVVVGSRGGYLLDVPEGCVDVARATAWIRSAREARAAGQPTRAAALARAALQLWRGEPLGDLATEAWADAVVTRLRALHVDALVLAVESELDLGRHGEVVGGLHEAMARHPYDERLPALAMLALYRAGRPAEALAVASETRRALGEDLGLDPGPELRDLESRVLRHDPTLAWRPQAAEADGPTVVAPDRSAQRAVLVVGTREVPLDAPVARIGRLPGQEVVLDDAMVSRLHAEVRRRPDDTWELADAGSTNGTTLNGRRVAEATALRPGDVIGVGGHSISFELR